MNKHDYFLVLNENLLHAKIYFSAFEKVSSLYYKFNFQNLDADFARINKR